MTLTFKFLPHEILNKPKPVPVCIYPLYPHEFFIREASDPFQACDHHSCPPLITEPRNHITKKKKKKSDPRKTHQPTSCQDPSSTLTHHCWECWTNAAAKTQEKQPPIFHVLHCHCLPHLRATTSRQLPRASQRPSSQRVFILSFVGYFEFLLFRLSLFNIWVVYLIIWHKNIYIFKPSNRRAQARDRLVQAQEQVIQVGFHYRDQVFFLCFFGRLNFSFLNTSLVS